MQTADSNLAIESGMTVTDGVAGTTDITGLSIDMADYDWALFIITLGAITANAVTSAKLQQSSDDGSADAYSDLLGTSLTIADDDDNQIKYIFIKRPQKRYIRAIVDRGTQNAVVNSISVIKGGCRKKPVTHGTNVEGESHSSPAEGTA